MFQGVFLLVIINMEVQFYQTLIESNSRKVDRDIQGSKQKEYIFIFLNSIKDILELGNDCVFR